MLTGLISSGSAYCVEHLGQKMPKCRNFYQICTLLGALVPIPSTDPGQILQEIVDPMVYAYTKFRLHRFILSPSRGEKLQIAVFGFRHFVLSPFGGK